MHARSISLVAALALLAGSAAVTAQVVDRTRDLGPFSTLDVRGCFDATLAPGSPARVVVSATEEQHDKIRVEQNGEVVTIAPAPGADGWDGWNGLCRGEAVRVTVTATFAGDANVELRLRGSGDLDAEVPRVASLDASLSGSGDLSLRGGAGSCEISISGSGDLTTRALSYDSSTEVSVNGSGDATLAGRTQTCSFNVHGSGDVVARDYECDSADVAISGSGSVDLARIEDIAVQIHGSGDVTYRGQPRLRRMSIHGSGELRQL